MSFYDEDVFDSGNAFSLGNQFNDALAFDDDLLERREEKKKKVSRSLQFAAWRAGRGVLAGRGAAVRLDAAGLLVQRQR